MDPSAHLNSSGAENVVLSFNGSPETHLNINGSLTNAASPGHSNNANNSGPQNNHKMGGAGGAHHAPHGHAHAGAHHNHNPSSHGGLVSANSAGALSAGVATHLAGSNAVNIADYFNQLVRDKKNIQMFPNYFLHCERLLDDEINKVKNLLCSATDRKPLDLPDPKGPTVTLTEKIFVPVDKYPNFNFVGRILGPQGTTAKDIEMYTGCKIMVRGEGSMRDKKKEEQLKGKPNFEHLNEKLHVLIQCEDTHNRGEIRMEAVIKEIKKLLDPKPDGEDEIKRRQLMGLAVLNGTYRETSNLKHHHHNQNHQQQHVNQAAQQLILPELAGLLPGLTPGAAALSGLNGLGAAGGIDQAALLAQLNQANIASLIGTPIRASGPVSAATNLGRFGVPSLLPGAAATLPNVSAANQNAAFLQANGLQSPTAEAGLLYAAAGYDPNMLQLGILSANSPVASQSDIGSAGAGSSESNFGKNLYSLAY